MFNPIYYRKPSEQSYIQPYAARMHKAQEDANKKPGWTKSMKLALWIIRFVFRYGYVPYVLYLGYVLASDIEWSKISPMAMMGLNFLPPICSTDEIPPVDN